MRLTRTARLVVVAGQLVLPFTLAQDYVSVLESVTSEAYGPSPTPSTIGALSSVSTISSAPSPSQTSSSNEPKVHIIKAGAGGFKFTPQEIQNVSVGDIVSWEFYPRDHSVARAEFGSACVPYEYTGKDKVGFWSETQWVNDTSQVCFCPDVRRCLGDIDLCLDYPLQHNHQLDRAHLLLLRGAGFVPPRAHGWSHQPELYADARLASALRRYGRLSGSSW